MEEYKGRKWSGIHNSKEFKEIEISVEGISKVYGHACTRCTDWGAGGKKKRARRSDNQDEIPGDNEV